MSSSENNTGWRWYRVDVTRVQSGEVAVYAGDAEEAASMVESDSTSVAWYSDGDTEVGEVTGISEDELPGMPTMTVLSP